MHQAILPSTYTSVTEVKTPHLDPDISIVPFWLLFFSFLGGTLLLFIFWVDLLTFSFHNLGTFHAPQNSGILCQYFVLDLLEVLHLFLLLLFLHYPLLFGFLPYLSLYCLSYLLSSMLYTAGLELLLLFMPFLHFIVLLFKHISVMFGDIRRSRGEYGDTEKKTKTFLFCLYIVNLDIIMGFFR